MQEFIFDDEPLIIYFDPKNPTVSPSRLAFDGEVPNSSLQYVWDQQTRTWKKIKDDDPDPPRNLEYGDYDGQIIDIIIDD